MMCDARTPCFVQTSGLEVGAALLSAVRREPFAAGVGLFGFASELAACDPALGVLPASRVLSTAASGPAILTHPFRERESRSRAFVVFGSPVGVALAFGAIAGGPLLA